MGRTLGSSDTSLAMLGMFIRQRKFSQISANHIKLDLHNIESFAIMDGNITSDHIGHNDTVTEMCLHCGRFLSRKGILLSFLAFHVETIIAMLDFWG